MRNLESEPVTPGWWRAPEARPDLALAGLNALRASPSATFRDVDEALSGLLAAAARGASGAVEAAVVRQLRVRLDRHLKATSEVDRESTRSTCFSASTAEGWSLSASTAEGWSFEALGESIVAALLAEPQTKLAIYGSLAPGEVNHSVIAGIVGSWADGFVRGDLRSMGWGSDLGFPALTWRPDGPRVPVKLLSSPDLVHHWQRLDRFEGPQYCRILVLVENQEGIFAVANLYEARDAPPAG